MGREYFAAWNAMKLIRWSCRRLQHDSSAGFAHQNRDRSRAAPAGWTAPPASMVSHVFTLSYVAEMLGEDEEWLFEVAEEMDTEDGQLWVVGVGEDGVMAFTDDGIENLKELIAIHKDTPSIIEKRRQALAAMMKL